MGVFDVLSKVTGGGGEEAADAEADDATDEVAAEDAVADPDDLEPADFREGAEMLSGRSDVPELDFTEESLIDLDSIATGNHPVDDPVVYGSYLGETLVREFDGEWVRDDGWAVEVFLGDDSTTVAVFDAARMALERGPIFEQVAEQLHVQGDPYAKPAEAELEGDLETEEVKEVAEVDAESQDRGSESESELVDDSDKSDDRVDDARTDEVDAADEPAVDPEPEDTTPVDESSDDEGAAEPGDAPDSSSDDANNQAEEAAVDEAAADGEPVDEDEPASASAEEDEHSVEPSEKPIEAPPAADTAGDSEQSDPEPDSPQPSESLETDTPAGETIDEDVASTVEDEGPASIESTVEEEEEDSVSAEPGPVEEGEPQPDTAADETNESPAEAPIAEERNEERSADVTHVDRDPSSAAEPEEPTPSSSNDEGKEEVPERSITPAQPPADSDDSPNRASEAEPVGNEPHDSESIDSEEIADPEDTQIDSGPLEPADRGDDDPDSADAVEDPIGPSEPSEAPEPSESPEPDEVSDTDEEPEPTTTAPIETEAVDNAPPLPTHSDFEAAALRFTKNWPDNDFDYSPASLTRLDRFLDDQWDGRFGPGSLEDSSTDPTESHSPLVNVGAYVGEILLRHYDGEWVRAVDGEPAVEVPGRHGRRETFPVFESTRRSLIHPARLAYEVDALAVRLDLDIRASGAEQTGFALGDGGPGTTASSADVITTILDRAEAFVERWPTYDLDYRPASLSRVDNLVDRELDTDAFPDATLGDWTDPDALRLADTAAGIAAYYSAVLVRHLDAQWEIDEEVALAVHGPADEIREVPFDVAVARLRGRGKLMPSYDRVYDAVNVDSRTDE